MLLGTTALAPTVAPWPTTAQCSTTLPDPARRLVLEDAALEMGEMADDAAVTDDGGEAGPGMDHGAVLNGRTRPDPDFAEVAAQDGMGPHARLGADRHVADDDGVGMDEGVGVDVRGDAVQFVDGHGRGRYTWAAIQVTP